MPSAALSASLPYHEPEIVTILIQSSLLLLLNVVNALLDKILYCGLIGQIFLGVAWGTPGAKWLEQGVEDAIVQLGYLGLLLLVYEGGLSTSLKSLRANIWLSLAVAITGITVPIGLSFILQQLTHATPIQCFAAGASLCSTSLGTTFTVLGTSGLTKSRLGVVLTSAAMMDDVVGLVLVQIISNLGQTSTSIAASTILRPLLVSVAFVVVVPLICIFVAKPVTRRLNAIRKRHPTGLIHRAFSANATVLSIHTLILLGYVAGATYAGTSNLFAAYIAGASISWWDSEVEHCRDTTQYPAVSVSASVPQETQDPAGAQGQTVGPVARSKHGQTGQSGLHIYDQFYSVIAKRILIPFFFASIGFSIPITEMFSGEIVWKGLVYAVLMVLAKVVCGLWLFRPTVRLPISSKTKQRLGAMVTMGLQTLCAGKPAKKSKGQRTRSTGSTVNHARTEPVSNSTDTIGEQPPTASGANQAVTRDSQQCPVTVSSKPRSLYPASIIGYAMVARGEIGFLISSIAESNGVFASGNRKAAASDLFLIVTWAIVLCTILGPLVVGVLVQRVKKLHRGVEKQGQVVHRDVLGVWGVE